MKSVNVVLAFVTVVLCLLVGAVLQSWVLLGMSLGIALSVFVLNKKLEQRHISRVYGVKDQSRPVSQSPTQYEEIHAPDFFN
jgi:hypothetical protein